MALKAFEGLGKRADPYVVSLPLRLRGPMHLPQQSTRTGFRWTEKPRTGYGTDLVQRAN